ncbi:hypothetical protein DU475_02065 [Rhodopseudomonas sp. WA056]|nr:hypothetical protein [Rhodopseudomonas sp. WA056]
MPRREQSRAALQGTMAAHNNLVIARLVRATQYCRAFVVSRRLSVVLDPRIRGDDGGELALA